MTISASPKLMPCWFCKEGEPKPKHDDLAYLPPYTHYVGCTCGACGPNCKTRDEAIAAWNRRSVPSPAVPEGLIEALKRIRDYGPTDPAITEIGIYMDIAATCKEIAREALSAATVVGGETPSVEEFKRRIDAMKADGTLDRHHAELNALLNSASASSGWRDIEEVKIPRDLNSATLHRLASDLEVSYEDAATMYEAVIRIVAPTGADETGKGDSNDKR